MKQYRMLVFIVVLIAIAIWIDLPNNPGIHIGNINKTIKTNLGLDLVGGVQALLEADLPASTAVTSEAMSTARTIVENRVNGLGVSEAVVQLAGARRIVVEIPGEVDPNQAISTIQETGLLEFVDMDSNPLSEGTVVQTDFGQSSASGVITSTGSLSATATTLPTTEPPTPTSVVPTTTATAAPNATPQVTPTSVPLLHTVMTGAAINTVQVTTNSTGQYVIDFTLTPDGAKIFSDYTTNNIGKYLGIVLDKKVISSPQVQNAITDGRGVISGAFTLESANNLALQLRYGSLPIPLKVVETNTVGPTLGEDSLRRSLIGGSIGLLGVIIFMGLYYRLPGIVADLALVVYALLAFALFKLIPVTLTLPGIAGFVLSIGMAVDANVLIFARLKEELRGGRSLHQAIDLGWARAWPSIRDSNFSTLITCAILFWFGSTFGASIVKGFSITLAIGVLVSLFTAINVTRTFLHLVLDNIKFTEHPKWFGV